VQTVRNLLIVMFYKPYWPVPLQDSTGRPYVYKYVGVLGYTLLPYFRHWDRPTLLIVRYLVPKVYQRCWYSGV